MYTSEQKSKALLIVTISLLTTIFIYLGVSYERFEHPLLSADIIQKYEQDLNKYGIESIVKTGDAGLSMGIIVRGKPEYLKDGVYEIHVFKTKQLSLVKNDEKWKLFYEPNMSNSYEAEYKKVDRAIGETISKILTYYNERKAVKATWE